MVSKQLGDNGFWLLSADATFKPWTNVCLSKTIPGYDFLYYRFKKQNKAKLDLALDVLTQLVPEKLSVVNA